MDDLFSRFTQDLIGRIGGPLSFRMILQPAVCMIFAVRDGINDAKTGEPAYFWSFFTDPTHLGSRLQHGWKSIGRVFVFAIVMDVIYQVMEFRRFYPVETFTVALVLAVIPYVLLRGPINRLVRFWRGPGAVSSSSDAR